MSYLWMRALHISKNIQIGLNRFRTNLVTDLQYKSVGKHTRNSAYITKSDTHYKEKVFPYGEFYMIISKMQLSESLVLLLKQHILFIYSGFLIL